MGWLISGSSIGYRAIIFEKERSGLISFAFFVTIAWYAGQRRWFGARFVEVFRGETSRSCRPVMQKPGTQAGLLHS
ncbi:hypothetical protein [Pseudomonas panipatensis]|jgi:hypothetical protein|uniref:hypothetical protein n=1 Tax=Pseudomonas panipatensis TaxID=428992 RepID=UPI0011138F81|nr:hypothetical protein [Pseudomonas panipatensis]